MEGNERRTKILSLLRAAEAPVSAGKLAGELGVSRQIIVGDVALLRAAGEEITATPRGYLLQKETGSLRRQIVCCHDEEGMERELLIIVDNGCTAVDVVVSHPVYGQITAPLALGSRYDVGEFLKKCADYKAHPLSALTGGIHLHTIAAPHEEAFQRCCGALRTEGFLVEP